MHNSQNVKESVKFLQRFRDNRSDWYWKTYVEKILLEQTYNEEDSTSCYQVSMNVQGERIYIRYFINPKHEQRLFREIPQILYYHDKKESWIEPKLTARKTLLIVYDLLKENWDFERDSLKFKESNSQHKHRDGVKINE